MLGAPRGHGVELLPLCLHLAGSPGLGWSDGVQAELGVSRHRSGAQPSVLASGVLWGAVCCPAPGRAAGHAGHAWHVSSLEGCNGPTLVAALPCNEQFGSPELSFPCQAAVLRLEGEPGLGLALPFFPDGWELNTGANTVAGPSPSQGAS